MHVDANWDKVCDGAHDPKLAGQVEWIRFVKEVNKILIYKNNFDITSDLDSSTLGGFGSPTQLGRDLHDSDGNHWPGFECYPDWIIFTNPKTNKARIELHNKDLIESATRAYDEVQKSYE
jgi:hypothetical protein